MVYSRRACECLRSGWRRAGWTWTSSWPCATATPRWPLRYRRCARGCDHILAVPLYPQYAASTTATAVDAVTAHAARLRDQPALRFVRRFHADPGYLDAQGRPHRRLLARARQAREAGDELPRPAARYSIELGDPYYRDCRADRGLRASGWAPSGGRGRGRVRSRFGAARWLEPYTELTLRELAPARRGLGGRGYCPGFVADCLETLEEVAQECSHAFLSEGASRFRSHPGPERQPGLDGCAGRAGRQSLTRLARARRVGVYTGFPSGGCV